MILEQAENRELSLYREIDQMRDILTQLAQQQQDLQAQQQQIVAGIQQRQGKLELLRELIHEQQPGGEPLCPPPAG